jgi:hypothetical protein
MGEVAVVVVRVVGRNVPTAHAAISAAIVNHVNSVIVHRVRSKIVQPAHLMTVLAHTMIARVKTVRHVRLMIVHVRSTTSRVALMTNHEASAIAVISRVVSEIVATSLAQVLAAVNPSVGASHGAINLRAVSLVINRAQKAVQINQQVNPSANRVVSHLANQRVSPVARCLANMAAPAVMAVLVVAATN